MPHDQKFFESMSLGERLRYAMEVRGIKQTELAAKIGVGQGAISNIVTDRSRKPSAPTLLKMAAELGIDPHWILSGLGDPYTWVPITEPRQVELLNIYRRLDETRRSALLATARCMAPQTLIA